MCSCIVDYRDCCVPKAGAPETKEFEEVQYEYWGLDEECYKTDSVALEDFQDSDESIGNADFEVPVSTHIV